MLRKIDKWVVNVRKSGTSLCFGFSTAEGATDFYEIVCESCIDRDASVTIYAIFEEGEE